MEMKAIFSEDRDDKLEHYGVKGMKWGKHKLWKKEDGLVDAVRNSVKGANNEFVTNLGWNAKRDALTYKLKNGPSDRIFGVKVLDYVTRHVNRVNKARGQAKVETILNRTKKARSRILATKAKGTGGGRIDNSSAVAKASAKASDKVRFEKEVKSIGIKADVSSGVKKVVKKKR